MSQTMNVELPNGRILEGVPVGTSKDVIRDKAIRAGLITNEEFGTPEERSMMDKILQSEYLDVGTGIGGALAGAGAGFMVAGPPGAIVGSILGGMGGTAGGELAEDHFQGKELDYWNAFTQSLISGGVDVVTLGAGKFIGKPAINFVKSRMAIGMTPDEAAAEYIKKAAPGVAPAGSPESLAASQAILDPRGATLTPFQATGKYSMSQKIADIGLFSQEVGKRNYEAVNRAVSDSFEEVINRVSVDEAAPQVIGQVLFDTIDAGRKASFQIYDEGMSRLVAEVGTTPVSTLGFRQTITRFKNQAAIAGKKSGVSGYDDATIRFMDEITADLQKISPTMTAKDLIAYEKKLMRDMSKFSDVKSNAYNSNASRDLAELSNRIRLAVSRELGRIDPKVAKEYSSIKTGYAQAIEGVLPKNLDVFIRSANEGYYERLGTIASTTGSADQLQRMMASLSSSHAQITKAGGELPVESLDVIKDKIRAGFLRNQFSELGSDAVFDISKYANRAERFNRPKEAARLSIIMGEKTPQVKQLFNLMAEASQKPSSNIGELMLRQKEYTAAQGLVSGALATQGPLGMASAGAILFSPVFLSKVAYNPRTVNRLIAFQNKKFTSEQAMMSAAATILNDAYKGLSEEEQAEITNFIRDEGS
jgi:hypothetical protein